MVRTSSFDRADQPPSQVVRREAHLQMKLTPRANRLLSWTRSIEGGHPRIDRTKNGSDRCADVAKIDHASHQRDADRQRLTPKPSSVAHETGTLALIDMSARATPPSDRPRNACRKTSISVVLPQATPYNKRGWQCGVERSDRGPTLPFPNASPAQRGPRREINTASSLGHPLY